MALRGDRVEARTDISFFMNETGERGKVLVVSTDGSGASMDDPLAVAAIPTTISGQRALGVLMNDVVNLDLTRQHLNQHKDEVQIGGKVTILTKGTIVTNILATPTVSGGQDAYFDSAGNLTQAIPADTAVEDHVYRVGRFLSTQDGDGYAKVEIDIL